MDLPPDVRESLAQLNNAMKEVTNAVKKFTEVSFEEHMKRPAHDQAYVALTALNAANGLAVVNERLKGCKHDENPEIELELRRQIKLEERYKECRNRKHRPSIDVNAADRFIRNSIGIPRRSMRADGSSSPDGSQSNKNNNTEGDVVMKEDPGA